MLASLIVRQAAGSSASGASTSAGSAMPRAFSAAHKSHVQSLYRRWLKNELDWIVRRDVWRQKAIEVRAEFERHRNITNPRHLAEILQKAEDELKLRLHPQPYRPPSAEYGSKWERNIPPRMFPPEEEEAAMAKQSGESAH